MYEWTPEMYKVLINIALWSLTKHLPFFIPGEAVCFHNYRVLHARSGFRLEDGDRHLEGAYIDWDELYSRRRVLQEELGISPWTHCINCHNYFRFFRIMRTTVLSALDTFTCPMLKPKKKKNIFEPYMSLRQKWP